MNKKEYAKYKKEIDKLFPSLKIKHKRPYGWIQWKGTSVCIDIHCKCGELMHFDGDFMYYIKCPHCNRVYECDGHIKLWELDFEPDNCVQVAE